MIIITGIFFIQMGRRMHRRSYEGGAKGNLGSIRYALSIYYGDMDGQYPGDLASLTVGGEYLVQIPKAYTPYYHPDSVAIHQMTNDEFNAGKFSDAGGWAYVMGGTTNYYSGTVAVNCTHTDMKGTVWTAY
ncbi:MAG: hypothetical protein ABIJ96_01645 [Elusimicrobiota bacterium]